MAKIAKGVLGLLAKSLRNQTRWEKELLIYAQTEYKKDWKFAYNYMLHNNGKSPNTHTWR